MTIIYLINHSTSKLFNEVQGFEVSGFNPAAGQKWAGQIEKETLALQSLSKSGSAVRFSLVLRFAVKPRPGHRSARFDQNGGIDLRSLIQKEKYRAEKVCFWKAIAFSFHRYLRHFRHCSDHLRRG